MQMDVRTSEGARLGRIGILPDERPSRIRPPEADRDVYLEWDGAIDDGGHLRTCLACGCSNLYRARSFPQLTPVVVVLAFAGAALALLGYATEWWILTLLAIVLALDILVLLLAESRLVCYQCGTIYRKLKIARYHTPWDRKISDKITKASDGE